MKVTIDVDCTPEEARAFLGLPDVQPLQEEMMAALRDRIRARPKLVAHTRNVLDACGAKRTRWLED